MRLHLHNKTDALLFYTIPGTLKLALIDINNFCQGHLVFKIVVLLN